MARFDMPQAELEAYRPDVREQADFDEFWAGTLAQARQHEPLIDREPGPISLGALEIEDVTYAGFDGHPIKAWYARPKGAAGPLPCIVEAVGYGGGRGLAIERTMWAAAGYAHLYIDTRGQGAVWGAGGDTADPVGSTPATPGFMTRGIEHQDDYYYRRVFTDAVRAVDTARSLPEVDASRVIFAGGSQAGGMALAVAGLVPELAAVMVDVPFLTHFERAIEITDENPYAEISQYLSVFRAGRDRTLDTLSYFDGVNHAKRATTPVLMSVALMDMVCPPSTVYAAYNHYGSAGQPDVNKEMVVYGFNGHEGGGAHQMSRQLQYVQNLLG